MLERSANISSILPAKQTLYRRGGKRALDIVLALIGIVVLGPLMLIAAVAVLADSGLPIVFRQRRCGLHGRPFSLYKFRSMTTVTRKNDPGFDAGSSARVTRVGRFLRKTKLDELLQLFNVLKGEMSIIGPRPEVPHWVERFPAEWEIAHTVRPGLSDEAAIVYRNEEQELSASDDADLHYEQVILPRKLAFYKQYAVSYSFKQDVKLILATLKAVLSR